MPRVTSGIDGPPERALHHASAIGELNRQPSPSATIEHERHNSRSTRRRFRASSFAQILQAGTFVITAEISPPLSCARADLVAKIMPLKGLADAVNVTDGASARAHMSALAAAAIMVEEGVEPILQFTCRDRNRIALQSDLLGAVTLGVRNFLMLRGDDPSKGDQPEAKPVFDLNTRDLIALAAAMRDKGEIPPGRKIGAVPALTIGAADLPVEPVAGWSPVRVACENRCGRAIRADAILHGCRPGRPLCARALPTKASRKN